MTQDEINEMNKINWWHRIPLEDGIITPGKCWHGPDGEDYFTERFGIPTDLRGKTVLDIGAWDGLFSFECERRGAVEVLAIDVPKEEGGNWGGTEGFNFARKILKSNVKFKQLNVYDLSVRTAGVFDIVLFLGVLYHLKYQLLALENIANVTREFAIIETALMPSKLGCKIANLCGFKIYKVIESYFYKLLGRRREETAPVFAFLPGWDNDPTNYWYPNYEGLRRALLFAGFRKVEKVWCDGIRVTVRAFK